MLNSFQISVRHYSSLHPFHCIINFDVPLQTTSAILQFRNVQNVCFAVSARSNRHESRDLTSKSRPQIRLALSQGRIRYLNRNICGHRRMRMDNPLKCHSLSDDCRHTTNKNLFQIDSRPICVSPFNNSREQFATKECH